MAKVWKVSKAFQSTDAETKEPQIVKTQGGDNHKFMVQVEGQPVDGWIGILKKPGNEVKVGDELYGDIVENNWGKPQFNRSQLPQDGSVRLNSGSAPAKQAQTVQKATVQPSGSVEEKLDFIISLLENFLGAKEASEPTQPIKDDGDEAVDLSDIEY